MTMDIIDKDKVISRKKSEYQIRTYVDKDEDKNRLKIEDCVPYIPKIDSGEMTPLEFTKKMFSDFDKNKDTSYLEVWGAYTLYLNYGGSNSKLWNGLLEWEHGELSYWQFAHIFVSDNKREKWKVHHVYETMMKMNKEYYKIVEMFTPDIKEMLKNKQIDEDEGIILMSFHTPEARAQIVREWKQMNEDFKKSLDHELRGRLREHVIHEIYNKKIQNTADADEFIDKFKGKLTNQQIKTLKKNYGKIVEPKDRNSHIKDYIDVEGREIK